MPTRTGGEGEEENNRTVVNWKAGGHVAMDLVYLRSWPRLFQSVLQNPPKAPSTSGSGMMGGLK